MGHYYCFGCESHKDDDYCPMADSELCDECDALLDGWTITYNPKPIPTRDDDWDYIHEDYDGENGLCGTAGSALKAMQQILEIENGY
jgi:hypothetical protein